MCQEYLNRSALSRQPAHSARPAPHPGFFFNHFYPFSQSKKTHNMDLEVNMKREAWSFVSQQEDQHHSC